MVSKEFKVLMIGFLLIEKIIIKEPGIIGSSWWQILHKPNPKPKSILVLFSKDKFLLGLSYLLLV